MKKYKLLNGIILLATSFALSSCELLKGDGTKIGITSQNDSSYTVSSSSKTSVSSNPSSSSEQSIIELNGAVKKSVSYTMQDFKNTLTPDVDDVYVLVVPFSLSFAKDSSNYSLTPWSSSNISFIENNYFGTNTGVTAINDKKWPTFGEFYSSASHNTISIKGLVTDVYGVTSETKISSLDNSYDTLYSLFDTLVQTVQRDHSDIDWSLYDRNNDGALDAVHFISNFNSATWSDTFWPHMSSTNLSPSSTHLIPNTYSLSSLEHFENSLTAIHEQGHMFGLDDYYDYASSNKYDFIGHADMQNENIFDWNSFSKLETGWATPTVITGEEDEVTVTLSAASLNGDCLLVPANYDTWNGTAFDEYFLFELFSPVGNNETSWAYYERQHGSLGDYGVRAYHVNANLFGYYNNKLYHLEVPDNRTYTYVGHYCTNSTSYTDYYGDNATYFTGLSEYDNYPLLSLVSAQDGKRFMTKSSNAYLQEADLFKQGDVFTFENAKYSLKKGGEVQTKMNNGESWNYSITFDEMSKEQMTVTIRKI